MGKYDILLKKMFPVVDYSKPTRSSRGQWNYQSKGKLYLIDEKLSDVNADPLPLPWEKELRVAKHPQENIYAYASSCCSNRSSCICLFYPSNSTKRVVIHEVNEEKKHGFDFKPAFSPNGKWLAFISEEKYGKISSKGSITITAYPVPQNKKTYNLGLKNISIKEFQWLNNNTILAEYNYKGYAKVCEISFNSVNPNDYKVTQIGNLKLDPKVERGGVLIAKGFHFDTNSHNDISYLNVGSIERCEYTTNDGIISYYWFAHPAKNTNNKRTILLCQGGPHHAWEPEIEAGTYHIPLLQHLGYSIIMPIVRGMPGITQEFEDQIRGDWGGKCIQDYLSALKTSIDKQELDKDKIALMGHSFGGFCAYYMNVTHPEYFCCFVAESGPFNLETFRDYCRDIGNDTMFSEMCDGLANPDGGNVMDKMLKQSPALLIKNENNQNNIKPILIIHGRDDKRVPCTQAEEAVKAFSTKEWIIYPNDKHVIINNKIDRYRRILEFLDKHM